MRRNAAVRDGPARPPPGGSYRTFTTLDLCNLSLLRALTNETRSGKRKIRTNLGRPGVKPRHLRRRPRPPARRLLETDSSRSATCCAAGVILLHVLRRISTNFSRGYPACCAANSRISFSRNTRQAASSSAWRPELVFSPVFETHVATSAASSGDTPASSRSTRARSACFGVQRASPRVVAGLVERVARARDGPALEMLAARGEFQERRRIGDEPYDPVLPSDQRKPAPRRDPPPCARDRRVGGIDEFAGSSVGVHGARVETWPARCGKRGLVWPFANQDQHVLLNARTDSKRGLRGWRGNQVFPPRSPRSPRFDRLGIGADSPTASFAAQLKKGPTPRRGRPRNGVNIPPPPRFPSCAMRAARFKLKAPPRGRRPNPNTVCTAPHLRHAPPCIDPRGAMSVVIPTASAFPGRRVPSRHHDVGAGHRTAGRSTLPPFEVRAETTSATRPPTPPAAAG